LFSVVLAVAGYLIAFSLFRKSLIAYQFILLSIFLVHLIYLEQLDYTLPIYILAAVLPLLPQVKIKDPFTVYLFLYNGLYVLIGIIAQNKTETLVSFLAKIFQFLVFFLLAEYKQKCKPGTLIKVISAAVFLESLLGVYLLLTSTSYSSSGLPRLVMNSQPIVGNISVAILPIIIWLYFYSKENERMQIRLLTYCVVLFVWTILSGTRGYIILFAVPMALLYIDYFFTTSGREYGTVRKRFIWFVLIAATAIMIVLVFNAEIIEKLASLLRANESLGIRGQENRLCLLFFKNAPYHVKIFGVGLGGSESAYFSYRAAVGSVMGDSWAYHKYLQGTGATFHNLFANILCTQGVIGLVNLVLILVSIMRRIGRAYENNRPLKCALQFYTICFYIMNWFRWSAACGIPEMIMLAFVINLEMEESETSGEKIHRKETISCRLY